MKTMIARLFGWPVDRQDPITPHVENLVAQPNDITPENLRLLQEEIMERQRRLEARLRLHQRVQTA